MIRYCEDNQTFVAQGNSNFTHKSVCMCWREGKVVQSCTFCNKCPQVMSSISGSEGYMLEKQSNLRVRSQKLLQVYSAAHICCRLEAPGYSRC